MSVLTERWHSLQTRPDSEHEQALVRLALGIIIGIYVTTVGAIVGFDRPEIPPVFLITVGGYVAALVIFLHVLFWQGVSPFRRVVAIVLDNASLSLFLYFGGEYTVPFYGIYLWFTLGYGFRYGNRYLFASGVLSVLFFLIVLNTTPFWQDKEVLGYGLLFTLIVIPAYASTLIRKLTEAKAEAEEASRAKSRFLATVSHELRTPLTAVIGLSSLIGNTDLDGEQRSMVRSIGSSAKALLSLINNILDFSKYEAGAIALKPERFDFYAFLAEIESMFALQAKTKGLNFRVNVSSNIPHGIVADAHRLRDVFVNLLGNALKFTSEGRIGLTVSAEPRDDGRTDLQFQIYDSGIGIPEDQQTRIFEQFSQADETVERKYGGTGLGLSIVKHLVAAMDGTMSLDSVEGKGSTFHVSLPVDVASEAELAKNGIDGQTVYIVSGNHEFCRRVSAVATGRGENPIPVAHAKWLLSEISEKRVGTRPVIVFDDSSTDLTATEFSQRAREADPNLRSVQILLGRGVSGPMQENDVRQDFAAVIPAPGSRGDIALAMYYAAYLIGGTPSAADTDRVAGTVASRKLRILLAEDNAVNQKVLAKIIESAGHDVTVVGTGDAALDALEENTFDLAFMDMNMPGMSGAEAVKLYRFASLDRPHLPIIALTADATIEAQEVASEAGMDDFITKPVEAGDLISAIDRMCPAPDDEVRTDSSGVAAAAASGGKLVDIDGRDGVVAVHPRRENALPPIIHQQSLETLRVLGDEIFFRELVDEFLVDMDRLTVRITTAVENLDSKEVRDATHALRSAAAHFGARRLHQLCMSVSQIRKEEIAEKGAAFIESLNQETGLVIKELRAQLGDEYGIAEAG